MKTPTKIKVDKYTEGGTIRVGIYRGKRNFAIFLTDVEAMQLAAALEYARRVPASTGWELIPQADFDAPQTDKVN